MSITDLPDGLMSPEEPDDPDALDGADESGARRARRRIAVIVYAPVEPDPKRFRFKLETTVGNAARIAATEFGYDASSTPSFATKSGEILDRSVTLEAAGVEHRDELELVDVGGGV